MKPSKEQIEAWAREVFGPSAYPLEGAIEMTNLAYAAGRKAGMEEAEAIAHKEGAALRNAADHKTACGVYHVRACIRAAMEADNG